MNVVYFGTDVFIKLFRHFIKKHHVMALYTYYNPEDYFTEYNIVCEAEENNIPVFYKAISEDDIRRYIADGCNLFFLAEYNRRIPCLTEAEGFYGINVHSSLLPHGRGYYPIENALMNGMNRTGVSFHKLTDKIDKGDVIAAEEFEISEYNDSVDVYIKAADAAYNQLMDIMQDFYVKYGSAAEQTGQSSLAARPDDAELCLRHDMTVKEAEEAYRCFNKMTCLEINDRLYRAVSMKCSRVRIDDDVVWISKNYIHYKLADGHARISSEPFEEAQDE